MLVIVLYLSSLCGFGAKIELSVLPVAVSNSFVLDDSACSVSVSVPCPGAFEKKIILPLVAGASVGSFLLINLGNNDEVHTGLILNKVFKTDKLPF